MDFLAGLYPPEVYCMVYYPNVCHVCKITNKNLKRCSKCKSLSYCSKIHQQIDWPIHRQLCRVITSTNKIIGNYYKENINFDDIKQIQSLRAILWEEQLRRKLDRFEQNMLQFPRICAVCYTENIQTSCEDCLNASYCSKEHQEVHRNLHNEYCAQLKLCMDLDIKYLRYCIDENVEKLFEDRNPWILGCDGTFCIPDDIKTFPTDLKGVLDYFNVHSSSLDSMKDVFKLDTIAAVSLLMYCLEVFNLVKERSFVKSKLTVHIVGADYTEVSFYWDLFVQLCIKWLKNINELKFYVIGPEVKPNTYKCDESSVEFLGDLYHNVIYRIDKPDIVVSFNNGIHEFCGTDADMWHESIKRLLEYANVPLILTAYTMQEIKKDIAIVRGATEGTVVKRPEENPFKSLRPIRNHDDQSVPVFYKNGYFALINNMKGISK
nr:unnamed protein product [Callosobruchus analis]CAI5860333.1 unnamed protein product [Callosobruchus analis]